MAIDRSVGMTLYGMVEEAVARWPHGDAVIYDDGVHVSCLTYTNLGKTSQKVRKWLSYGRILILT